MRRLALAVLIAWPSTLAAQSPPTTQQQEPAPTPTQAAPAAAAVSETIDVIAVTPLHGSGLPRLFIPANVQVITPGSGADGLTDLGAVLTRGMATLHANEAQGGTFQPDVVYRGFGGSPLLGASEGLAVYLDGVRANEPFGDIVNWDSLPPGAIANINVMAGSSPLFGLNALGGAVSVRTRDGFTTRGSRVAVSAGAFARFRGDAEIGARRGRLAGFVAASFLDEGGWRDYSPSALRRGFGKASWRSGSSAADLAVTLASNDLLGNGTAPERLLAQRRRAVFTHPDRTDNDLAMITARFDRVVTPTLRIETLTYFRRATIGTVNGDAADHDAGDHAAVDDREGPALDATVNRSRTATGSGGATTQVVWTRPVRERSNQAIVGLGFDAASSDFMFHSEYGSLSPTRQAIGAGVFDSESAVALDAVTRTASAFLTDTLDVAPGVHVTASARANWTTIGLRDRIGVDLNGDHAFTRLNPSLGATVDVSESVNVFAAWSQSSRVPTPVELTCADPDDPCRLPNAFVSDPPLDQPVARTWEAGARGGAGRGGWSLAVFTTDVNDDVIFVSSGRVRGSGHFENVERTHRRGLETTGEWRAGRVMVSATYTYQRATYGTDLSVSSALHPDADGGALQVQAGASLPGVPAHVGRIGLTARVGARLEVATAWRAQSSQFLRGDEANRLAPLPAFSTLDARARWRIGRRIALLAQVANMFDAGYSTFGALGDATLLGEAYEDAPRFVSPGAPRAAWAGIEVGF